MTKRKHHFVPLFYLRAFQSAERRIHLHTIEKVVSVPDASLKHQCYVERLHGSDDNIENALGQIESAVAPVIQAVTRTGSLPDVGSAEEELLYIFAAMQLVRVPKIAERINLFVDKITKQTYSGPRSIEGLNIEEGQFGFADPVLVTLRLFPEILLAISDLKAHLLVASRKVFITSDNPVVRYNQYCEGVEYGGGRGATSKGLQLFLPLSPRHCLVLYDGTTYKAVAGQFTRTSGASQSDIETLNKLQLLSADSNIYFSDWEQFQNILPLLPEVNDIRGMDRTVVEEFGHDNDPGRALIMAYEGMENLSVKLTFLTIKGAARKIPSWNRPQQYRDQPYRVEPLTSTLGNGRDRIETYSQFIGRR